MKRVVIAVILFGIASCAVETAPASKPATVDDEATQSTSADLTSSPFDDNTAPRGVACDESCETRQDCKDLGGIAGPPCAIPSGTVCCSL